MASPDPLFGREALLTGSLDARLHGLYLICRMLLEDRECPPAWCTANQFPTPMLRNGMSGPAMVMTPKGVFGQNQGGVGAPAPPQPHQQRAYPSQQPLQVQRSPYMGQVPITVPPSALGAVAGAGAAGVVYNQFQPPNHSQPPIQPPHPAQMGHAQMMPQQVSRVTSSHRHPPTFVFSSPSVEYPPPCFLSYEFPLCC